MKTLATIVFVYGVTAAVGVAGASQLAGAGRAREALVATHAIRGVVKGISAPSLVLAPSSHKVGDLTFVLTPATVREGAIAVGATVSVRYRTEGTILIATAIVAHSRAPGHKAV